jgi:hypothetical protein
MEPAGTNSDFPCEKRTPEREREKWTKKKNKSEQMIFQKAWKKEVTRLLKGFVLC